MLRRGPLPLRHPHDMPTLASATTRRLTALPRHPLFAASTSCFLGVLSLVTVLCFHFPDLLTSREIRAIYTEGVRPDSCSWSGSRAAFALRHRSQCCSTTTSGIALTGVGAATVAVLLGGSEVPFDGPINSDALLTRAGTGSCWHCSSPHWSSSRWSTSSNRRPVAVFRKGWRTDAAYFFMSHVLVQLILISGHGPRPPRARRRAVEGAICGRPWVGDLPFLAQFLLGSLRR